MEFKISSKILLDDIEEYIDKVHHWEQRGITIDLVLPAKLDNNYFGLVVSLIQLGVTWARSEHSRYLYINPPADSDGNDDWNKLYENELIFPLVALVWNTHEIRRTGTQENIRSQLQVTNNLMFARMRTIKTLDEPLKGSKLLLTQFDHFIENRGILPCFERDGRFLLNWKDLRKNLQNGLDRVLAYSQQIQDNFAPIQDDAVIIIYELMKNTFEWAREDADGVALDPNLRGMLVRFFKKKRTTLLEDFDSHKGLTDYFSSEMLKENSVGDIYFLEISVVDSGIGLVNRYRKSVPKAMQLTPVQVVKECLIKHNTTASGLGKKDKGRGLDRILATLNERGFIRIKTGEVCVYRNLISDPYRSIERGNTDQMQLFDWTTGSNSMFQSHAQAEGAAITIVYPLST